MKLQGTCTGCGRRFTWTWKELDEDKGAGIRITYTVKCPRCPAPVQMSNEGAA